MHVWIERLGNSFFLDLNHCAEFGRHGLGYPKEVRDTVYHLRIAVCKTEENDDGDCVDEQRQI